MTLTKFVSAQFINPPFPGGEPIIRAIGDDGVEYFVSSMESDVPPWPQFLEDGGTVKEADPPE